MRENTFRIDYSQFPKPLTHDVIHKFVGKELGLTRENVLQLQPSRRLACTFVKVDNLELAERIVEQHDNKHEFVFDGKSYKLRVTIEDGAVDVQLFDLPEDITNNQISTFLADYGDVLKVRDLLWDNRYGIFEGVKTGVRVARMIVKKNIPSLVRIQGEDTAVAYRGQRQTCIHCHEFAHIGIPCVQNKKLLVQKLAADLSYAKVARMPPQQKLVTSKKTPPKQADTQKQNSAPEPKPSTSVKAVKPKDKPETRSTTAQQKQNMPPPATSTSIQQRLTVAQVASQSGAATGAQRKLDGNETDSSQASTDSLRSRRQPSKKMRHTEDDSSTTEHEHMETSIQDTQ